MKNSSKTLPAFSLLLSLVMLTTSVVHASELTDVNLEITNWIVTIWAPAYIKFPTTTAHNFIQESVLTATWTSIWTWAASYDVWATAPEPWYNPGLADDWLYFWVEDLRSSDAWWTTNIKISELTSTWTVTKVIAASQVRMRIGAWTFKDISDFDTPPASLEIDSWVSTYTAIDVAQDAMTRTWASDGIVWKYWFLPEFSVRVPAYQALGSYTGTLTYTLSEND